MCRIAGTEALPQNGVPGVRLVLSERLLSALEVILGGIVGILLSGSPSVVSEATAEARLVASSESAAVAFDTTT